MAATLKTYDVVCPDPDCTEEFQVERDPAELATGEGDLIPCPLCGEEWEWDYIQEGDTLELTGGEFEDLDDAESMELDADQENEEDEE